MTAKSLIALLGLFLIVAGLARTISLVAVALTPGIFASSIAGGFRNPTVAVGLVTALGELLLGALVIAGRNWWWNKFGVRDEDGARIESAGVHLGPFLFQMVALYLLITNLAELPMAIAGLLRSSSGIALKANFVNLLIQGKLESVFLCIFALVLLLKARWLHAKLWPER